MNSGKLLSGILIGAAAGAILGVLFAPEKGTETRGKISKKGADLIVYLILFTPCILFPFHFSKN